MTGTFVAVVGPSGAGKDSVMNFARDRLGEKVVIVRRVVTRAADGGSEEHDSLSREDFAAADKAGQFALSWEAHGLSYGLPNTLEKDLAAGLVVIANLSRAVLPRLVSRFPTALVVEVTARPEVIASRLVGRGREDGENIKRRIARSASFHLPPGTFSIDNSGDLQIAGDRFVALLRDLLRLPGD